MVFKGDKSLSEVFGLIDRFSEDIDLVLDWRLLGYHQKEAKRSLSTHPIQDPAKPSQPRDERKGSCVRPEHAVFSTQPSLRADPWHSRQNRRGYCQRVLPGSV